MKRHWALLALGGVLAATGCQEAEVRDQWVVTFATDAPLPQFGDRLMIEVLRDGQLACSGCRRIFGLEGDELPASFGIAAPEGASDELRLRMRLYRTDHTGADGIPEGNAHLDLLARLPAPSGLTPVSAVARMSCFGVVAEPSLDQTCDAALGALGPAPMLEGGGDLPEVGSWVEAAPVPCEGPVPDDMVCIEGGVFLLGSPLHFHLIDALGSEPEHLVKLSPFAIERDEITVGEARQLVVDGLITGTPMLPASDPMAANATCSYLGPDDPTNDALPLNCVSHAVAEQICAALGRRLPTEAEWEFTAGQRELETPYPWGYDDDVCSHAVVAVGRFNEAYVEETITCRIREDGTLGDWGYLPGGHELDVTREGVRNLGGNVAEWVADWFHPYSAGCYAAEGTLLVDPQCSEVSDARGYRGGGWLGLPGDAQNFIRKRSNGVSTNLGVRCALSR